jgi:hypothetical protein
VIALIGELESARASAALALAGVLALARMATRTCDGRVLAAPGVNLNSESDGA